MWAQTAASVQQNVGAVVAIMGGILAFLIGAGTVVWKLAVNSTDVGYLKGYITHEMMVMNEKIQTLIDQGLERTNRERSDENWKGQVDSDRAAFKAYMQDRRAGDK